MRIVTVHVAIGDHDPDEPAYVAGLLVDSLKEYGPIWTHAEAGQAEKHPADGHEPSLFCEDEECRNFAASMSDDGLSNPAYDIEYRAWLAQRNQV
jgi:hypothetical protein